MKRILGAVVGCGLIVACGGVQTSVPGGSQVSSLSVDQTRQLCRDRQKYLDSAFTTAERKTFGCSFSSLIGGAIAGAFGGVDAGIGACEMAFTQCESGSGATSDAGTSDPCAMVMVESTCSATVSDFNTCYTEQIESLRPFAKGNQCSSLASADAGTVQAKGTTCDKIASSCERAKTYSW